MSKNAIVIGAGIVGLATARALVAKGFQVKVFERSSKAVGASIRNFGMIWPIGQPEGTMLNRAMRSREIWKDVAKAANIWHDECGSIHLAYHADEQLVLTELYETFSDQGRAVQLLSPAEIKAKYNGINSNGLLCGLYSDSEMIVNSPKAIPAVASYLAKGLDVEFYWDMAISRIETGKVFCGNTFFEADLIVLCSGSDFETLFPASFSNVSITKCKLQMMKFVHQDPNFRINSSVCGGLSLIHYSSFQAANSLAILKKRYQLDYPEYVANGIHVMVSQNDDGELIVGDTHEYSLTFDPFERAHLNKYVLDYLATFMHISDWKLTQTWNGIYPKMTDGNTEVFLNPLKDVYAINGVGGAGMTLSFGLAEELIQSI